jgi:hypothetical protein
MLASPAREFPEFPAAVSLLALLAPEQALSQLVARRAAREAELAEIERRLRSAGIELPRVVVLEEEYRRAMVRAEIGWLDGVIADLRSGALRWDYDELRAFDQAFTAAQAGGGDADVTAVQQ